VRNFAEQLWGISVSGITTAALQGIDLQGQCAASCQTHPGTGDQSGHYLRMRGMPDPLAKWPGVREAEP
jgi:hypothetical protein